MFCDQDNRYASNYQDLFKVIALVAMILDHLGLYFYSEVTLLRMIGRIAMPIFCFFAGYNAPNKSPKHIILLYSWLLFILSILVFETFNAINILLGIYLGQCYLWLFRSRLKSISQIYMHIFFLSLLIPFTQCICEYGTATISLMILGYATATYPKNKHHTLMSILGISFIQNIDIFKPEGINLWFLSGEYLTLYGLLAYKNFNQTLPINLNFISRNMLPLYFVQLALIQIIWKLRLY